MAEMKTNIINDGEGVIIHNRQDVSGIIAQNKRAQADGVNMQSGMRHAASVPITVWETWMKEFKAKHKKNYHAADAKTRRKFMALKLNDPDNAFMRTWKGRI